MNEYVFTMKVLLVFLVANSLLWLYTDSLFNACVAVVDGAMMVVLYPKFEARQAQLDAVFVKQRRNNGL